MKENGVQTAKCIVEGEVCGQDYKMQTIVYLRSQNKGAYGKAGNGNWKQKWEQKHTNHWYNVFFIVCLVINLVFYLAMVIGLAFVLCFVMTTFT